MTPTPPEPTPETRAFTRQQLLASWKEHLDAAISVGELADTDVKYLVDLADGVFFVSNPAHPSPACAEAATRARAACVALHAELADAAELVAPDTRDYFEALILRHCSAPLAPAKQGGAQPLREVIERVVLDSQEGGILKCTNGILVDRLLTALTPHLKP